MDTTAGVRSGLQAGLRASMRARDAAATRALRSVLAAIANAEAVTSPVSAPASDSPIAGAVTGLGAGDVARRVLTDADVAAILQAEIDERVQAAAEYDRHGRAEPGVLEPAGQPAGTASRFRERETRDPPAHPLTGLRRCATVATPLLGGVPHTVRAHREAASAMNHSEALRPVR